MHNSCLGIPSKYLVFRNSPKPIIDLYSVSFLSSNFETFTIFGAILLVDCTYIPYYMWQIIMHQSIPSANSKCQVTPGVLHLLSAQVPGFVPSELSGGCPRVRPTCIICYHKYSTKLSADAIKALFSFKLIYHLLLLSCYKICLKAGGKL